MALLDVDASDDFIASLRPAFAELVSAADYAETTREEKAAALYDLVQARI